MARFILGALTFFFPRSFDWRGLAERCACPLWTRSEVFPVEVSASPLHVCADTGNDRRTTIPLRRSRLRTSSPLTSVDSRRSFRRRPTSFWWRVKSA